MNSFVFGIGSMKSVGSVKNLGSGEWIRFGGDSKVLVLSEAGGVLTRLIEILNDLGNEDFLLGFRVQGWLGFAGLR